MFLNTLQEKNKELFLELCVKASLANGVFADEEKEMINAYCREMDVPEHIPDEAVDLDSIIASLNEESDEIEKKIVILEILGLVRADGLYDEKEKVFIKKIADGLNIKDGFLDRFNSLLEIYTTVCREIRTAICE